MENAYIAVDVETTGLSTERAQLIEIGAVVMKNQKEVARFSKLINPGIELPERIIELTGITQEMVNQAESERTVIKEFLAFIHSYDSLFEGDMVMLGHNIGFDYSFLKTAAVRNGSEFKVKGIDTLKIARIVHADLLSKRLEDMCSYYQINTECSHRAFEDALAAAILYERMKERFYDAEAMLFVPGELSYTPKKQEPITAKQKKYLSDLCTYHNLEVPAMLEEFTKSRASQYIDKIILQYGMPKR